MWLIRAESWSVMAGMPRKGWVAGWVGGTFQDWSAKVQVNIFNMLRWQDRCRMVLHENSWKIQSIKKSMNCHAAWWSEVRRLVLSARWAPLFWAEVLQQMFPASPGRLPPGKCVASHHLSLNGIYIVCIFRSLTHYITLRHAALHYTALRYIALCSLDSLHYSVLYTWPFITHGTLNHIYSIMWHHWYVFDIIATWCIKGQIQAKPRHAARSDSV